MPILAIGERKFGEIMTKDGIETAWDYCRECLHFDSDGLGICSGFSADIPCPDGNAPCASYWFQESKAPLIGD